MVDFDGHDTSAVVDVQRDVDLQNLTTLGVVARANYLCTVTSIEQLQFALDFAKQRRLNTLVLGQGSNTVLADNYSGLVILNRITGIKLVSHQGSEVLVRIGAGEDWHQCVEYCLSQGWYGLENLALIPGKVGAAPIQNIGAYGVELKDVFHSLTLLDKQTGERKTMDRESCQFRYRDSIFKGDLKDATVITDVTVRLSTCADPVLTYPALREVCAAQASAEAVFNAVCKIRRAKLPDPSVLPNAGSFFKNPIVSLEQLQTLRTKSPDLVAFEHNDQFKLAAAWMIEQRGWKDRVLNGVQVHQHQALVIINPTKQCGRAVLELAHAIQIDILDHFGVPLEIEPAVVNGHRPYSE